MGIDYITFRSVTPAQRGAQVLGRGGIWCSLQRTPRWMEAQGCGYCLRLRTADGKAAVALLRQNRVPFRKVYTQDEKEQFREVTR